MAKKLIWHDGPTNVILQFAPGAVGTPEAHDFRVDVRVVVGRAADAVRAPLGALFRRGEGWALYKVVDGKAVATAVIAAEADGRFRAITSGLAPGDQVIVFPSAEIADGVRVKARKSRDS